MRGKFPLGLNLFFGKAQPSDYDRAMCFALRHIYSSNSEIGGWLAMAGQVGLSFAAWFQSPLFKFAAFCIRLRSRHCNIMLLGYRLSKFASLFGVIQLASFDTGAM